MRRVVDKESRKKALFSCDNCKKRKIACRRQLPNSDQVRHEDTSIPCVNCSKKNIECKTTIQRKKRQMGPVENLGLHYKILIMLFEGLFPELDVNNIDSLIQLGLELNLNMPSRSDLNNDSIKEIYDLGYIISSYLKSEKRNPVNLEDDRFILDERGVSHYIGPRASSNYLSTTSVIMQKASDLVSSDFKEKYNSVYYEEIMVSSNLKPINADMLIESDIENFPFVILDKAKTDVHVQLFFDRIYPFYPCFSKRRFFRLYEKWWDSYGLPPSERDLDSSEVCFLYLIKTMGYYYLENESKDESESRLIGKLVNIVKLSISEFMLTPTINGILCLFYLAVLFNKNKRRECGYLLITSVCRQATVIGLNRQSMIECNPDVEVQEEMKKIWWAIVEQEVKLSSLLGRVPSFNIADATVDLPSPKTNSDLFYNHSVKLLKIVYLFNQTSNLSTSYDFGTKERAKIVTVRLYMKEWLHEVQDFLKIDDESILLFKFRLQLEFHHNQVCLLFPFILNLPNCASSEDIHEFDLQMVVECLKSLIDMRVILVDSDKVKILNSFWSPHIQYAFEATLCLCNVYIWMENRDYSEITDSKGNQVSLDSIQDAMIGLREFNRIHVLNSKGSVSKLSKFLEIMLSSFYFMDEAYLNKNVNNELKEEPFYPSFQNEVWDVESDLFGIDTVFDELFSGQSVHI